MFPFSARTKALRWVRTRSFAPFVIYRVVLGVSEGEAAKKLISESK